MGQRCCTQAKTQPDLRNWSRLSNELPAIWRHNSTGEQIEEHYFMCSTEDDFAREIDSFNIRQGHQYLVASKFLSNHVENQLCSRVFKGELYLQRIFLRLSRIKDIPYPDVLHVYDQALRGFKILAGYVGYFLVEEDMICVNMEDRVKVWVNGNLTKSFPSTIHLSSQIQMVMDIVDKIQINTYKGTMPSSFKSFLVQRNVKSFDQAIVSLFEFARIHHTVIPHRLECVGDIRRRTSQLVQSKTVTVVNKPPAQQRVGVTPPGNSLTHAKSCSQLLVRHSRMADNSKTSKVRHAVQMTHKASPARQLTTHSSKVNLLAQTRGVSMVPKPFQASDYKASKTHTGSILQNRSLSPVPRPSTLARTPERRKEQPPSPYTYNKKPMANGIQTNARRLEDGHTPSHILSIINTQRQKTKQSRLNLVTAPVHRQEVSMLYRETELPTLPLQISRSILEPFTTQNQYSFCEDNVLPKSSRIMVTDKSLHTAQSLLLTNPYVLKSQVETRIQTVTRHSATQASMVQTGGNNYAELLALQLQAIDRLNEDSQHQVGQHSPTKINHRQTPIRSSDKCKFQTPRKVFENVSIERNRTVDPPRSESTAFQFYGFVGLGRSNNEQKVSQELQTNEDREYVIRVQLAEAEEIDDRAKMEIFVSKEVSYEISPAKSSYQSTNFPNTPSPYQNNFDLKQSRTEVACEITYGEDRYNRHNLTGLVSIYIPIDGYKVTMNNQILQDLQRLRGRSLMQEAERVVGLRS